MNAHTFRRSAARAIRTIRTIRSIRTIRIGTFVVGGALGLGALMMAGCSTTDLERLLGNAPTRLLVRIDAPEAAAVDNAVAIVESAVAPLPGLLSVRTVACATGGALLVSQHGPAAGPDPAATLAALVDAKSEALPVGVAVQASLVSADIAVVALKGKDPFAARRYVDDVLGPALRNVDGIYDLEVVGGAQEAQIQVDPERLLAADVSLPEVLGAISSSTSLEKTVVKTGPGGLVIRLTDVATLADAPAGEPLRRDGGVEVIVRGAASRRTVQGIVDDIVAQHPPPAQVVVLDEDSVEVVHVLVTRKGGPNDEKVRAAVDATAADVAAASLSVPGVHAFRHGRRLQLTLDSKRLQRFGLSKATLATVTKVAQAATTGLVVQTAQGPRRLILAAATTPEALLRTRVATRPSADGPVPVHLFDIARATLTDEGRRDKVDFKVARRLRLSIDAGARQPALRALETRLAAIAQARPGVDVRLETDREAAPLESICF